MSPIATCAASAPGSCSSPPKWTRTSMRASGGSRSPPPTRRSTWRERLAGRRAPVKAAILDQRTVAGVGNIYADEALWRRTIHPLTPADELGPGRGEGASTAASGRRSRPGCAARARRCATTASPTAETGGAQHEFKVYGRGGEPCDRCGTPIDKIRVAGRGTWYCPTLPAPLRGEQVVEPAVALQAPELGVAADRAAVDQDLRHGPAAGQVVQRRSEAGSSSRLISS